MDLDVPRVPAEYVDDEWSPTVLAFTTDLSPCTGYPVGERLPQAPIAGSPEVLVLASTGDPLTPASLLDYSPSITSVASVCVTDVPGHTSFADPDVAALVTDFLADGSTSASGACGELRTP